MDDVRAAILESEVYDGVAPDDQPVELTATLLDPEGDALSLLVRCGR
jgi:hypothetical protein